MRIDLFVPTMSRYGVLHHFTEKFYDALCREGADCRLLNSEYSNPKPFLDSLFADKPACTLSFNGVLPDQNGVFLCDLLRVPHISYLVDSPIHFSVLTESPLNIITCPDRRSCQLFKELNFEKVLFMPHAVERELVKPPGKDCKFEVVFLGSCIDYETIRENWRVQYQKSIFEALVEAAERGLTEPNTSYIHALVEAVNKQAGLPGGVDPRSLNYLEILGQLEDYIRGRDRIELLRSMKETKIDLYGAAAATAPWEKYLRKMRNIAIHEQVSFQEALEIMQQSKVVLHSCPWIKDGLHERILCALSGGASVAAEENPYLKEQFPGHHGIVYYQHKTMDSLEEKINDLLKNESKRLDGVKKAQKVIKDHHTWDHRAEELLKKLPDMLELVEFPKKGNPVV